MRYNTILKDLIFIVFVVLGLTACQKNNSGNMVLKEEILNTSGLVALWDFKEKEGQNRLAYGEADFPLQEKDGIIPRIAEGPLSGYSALFGDGAYLSLPNQSIGKLNSQTYKTH